MKTDALQSAIYNRLNGYAPVSGAVQAIYTTVPQAAESEDDSAFPYITIGPIITSPDDTKSDSGVSALVDIHIWSRSRSALTWRAIASDVYDALQKYDALAVAGADVVDCRFDSSTEFPDPDGRTTNQVSTFRVTYRF